MNKHIFFLGIAATLFLGSCSSDSDVATGNDPIAQVGNSDEPILLSLNQKGSTTRAALGNLGEDGQYDGTFDTNELGVYCLATGKIFGTEDINWNTDNNPNFKWLENIRSKAVTTAVNGTNVTDLQWYDGAKRYYPMGSQYRYSFYGYYPYSSDAFRDGNEYKVRIDGLDGTKDVIWGKTTAPEGEDYAYSALYFREKRGADPDYDARKYLPNLTFTHKLMKFNIILKKGTGEGLDKIGVEKATLHNVATSGTLTIASLNGQTDGKFEVDWSNTTTLTLKGQGDADLEADTYLGDQNERTVGEGFMLPVLPKLGDNYYQDNGFSEGGLGNKGIFRLRVDFKLKGDDTVPTPYKAAQYEIVPPQEGWQEGYEYDIVISVSTPLDIAATASLTPWNKKRIDLQ